MRLPLVAGARSLVIRFGVVPVARSWARTLVPAAAHRRRSSILNSPGEFIVRTIFNTIRRDYRLHRKTLALAAVSGIALAIAAFNANAQAVFANPAMVAQATTLRAGDVMGARLE